MVRLSVSSANVRIPRQPSQAVMGFLNRLPLVFDPILKQQRHAPLVLLGALLWLAVPLLTLRLAIWQQGVVALVFMVIGNWLLRLEEQQNNASTSEQVHLVLITLSTFMTLRYLYYRTCYTLSLDSWLNIFFCFLLYAAEMYAIATLFFAYFQTIRIRERKSIDLSLIPQTEWLNVDIYIPTYNEDVEIVRKTVIAAMAIEYPSDKKCVYVLDDGRKYPERRVELQAMCDETGCTMMVRDNNDHAKAGNINTALEKTGGDLVLILDCDHIPARCILQETVGFFTKPEVALVQTPHWFYNPDPFERNLLTGGRIPVGNELFYKVLQKGNDNWNAAFFCGSAAVVRRDYVRQIGGIATETVTEDCHTALRLHSLGYESVYYDKIMVAGLAPEKFSSYIGQQVRWARGMAQILRIENPLFNRTLKLSIPQRLCYFSATSHFFFGFPRLMYVVAPIVYMLLGISSVRGLGIETLFYALPHILLSMQTNHIPYKHVRFSFWNEIYEFAMSFQAGIVTLLALINPKLGSFNVTDKGLTVTERNFDFESVRYLVYLSVVAAASLLAIPFWLLISPQDIQSVLINALWNVFNLFLLLAACLVAFEQPQLRDAHRLPRQLTAMIHSGTQTWTGVTTNVSESGALILFDEWPNIPDEVRVQLVGDYGASVLLDAHIIRANATSTLQVQIAVNFINLSRTQIDDLVVVLYSDVKEWYSQKRQETDNAVSSFKFIAASMRRVFQEFRPEARVKVRKQVYALAYLFWDGWGDVSYAATVTEIGVRDLRLEMDIHDINLLNDLQESQALLSLLVLRQPNDPDPQSLIAEIRQLDVLSSGGDRVMIELGFPVGLERQQKDKIRQLVRSLN